jgi:chromosome segregation ATPase
MRKSWGIVYALMLFLPIFFAIGVTHANDVEMLQELYKKIASGLISIRKEYPQSQTKIYAMLDQLDKLYSLAKNDEQKSLSLEKRFQDKVAENATIKNELSQIKSDMHNARKSLETAKSNLDQKLEDDRSRIQSLSQERSSLLSKIAHLEAQLGTKKRSLDQKNDLVAMDDQKIDETHPNLSRISTSEPISPP